MIDKHEADLKTATNNKLLEHDLFLENIDAGNVTPFISAERQTQAKDIDFEQSELAFSNLKNLNCADITLSIPSLRAESIDSARETTALAENHYLATRLKQILSPSVIFVTIIHVAGFLLLLLLAEQTVDVFVEIAKARQEDKIDSSIQSQLENNEINAYFISAEQLAAISQATKHKITPEQTPQKTPAETSEPSAEVNSDSATTIAAIKALENIPLDTEVKPVALEQVIEQAPLPAAPIEEVIIEKVTVDELSNVEPINDKTINTAPSKLDTEFNWSSVDSMYLQEPKDEAVHSHLFNKNELSDSQFNVLNSATSNVLQNLNQQALQTLVSQQARRATSGDGASLSELTPEMFNIEIIEIEDKRQATTLDHRLDPNRIMKHGDTCYRIVPLPTQINPHAEGLGFAEPCDSARMKKALNRAIQNRLSKVQLP
ncbi:hypothetical protein [Shewanella goraebulensis]|uniref:hypothetical protein n=1 Tax=Shewanella goraebulensis TaxID=3050637 RepID=UPI00254ADBA9|nr:hypothetical protein [Shewanella goraebulensis]